MEILLFEFFFSIVLCLCKEIMDIDVIIELMKYENVCVCKIVFVEMCFCCVKKDLSDFWV